MPVAVLFAVLVAGVLGLLFAADRAAKMVRRARRRRQASRRLLAAAARAEAEDQKRRAAAEASGALTSLLPTIHDHDPRHVN
jgi:hypothetical protein